VVIMSTPCGHMKEYQSDGHSFTHTASISYELSCRVTVAGPLLFDCVVRNTLLPVLDCGRQ